MKCQILTFGSAAILPLIFLFSSQDLLVVAAKEGTEKKDHKEQTRPDHKVFGVGLHRSGTDSLKIALTHLGFGPTYHMKELLFEESGLTTSGDIDLWHKAALGIDTNNNLATILEPWGSGTDMPLAAFQEDLLQIYPDAKFVLTIRPAEKWFDSISNSVCHIAGTNWYMPVVSQLPFFPFTRFKAQRPMVHAASKIVFEGQDLDYQCDPANREATLKSYDEWSVRVQKTIPKEQLLVFRTGKDGYEELASFLGVPVPDEPYPRSNSKEEFKSIVSFLQSVAIGSIAMLVFAFGYVLKKLGSLSGAAHSTSDRVKMH
jgi:hypothetical protein